MVAIKIRYMVPRKRKGHTAYYWIPIKKYFPEFVIRALGRDLDEAIIKAQRLNKDLDEWLESGVSKNQIIPGTVAWLIDEYLTSKWFDVLAPRTKKDYMYQLDIFRKFGKYRIEHITRKVCKEHYNSLLERSVHNANAQIRVVKILFSFAIDGSFVDGKDNPAKGIRLISTSSRFQVWTHEECAKYVDAATKAGRESIALAVIIAENTAQRQADILQMKRSQYDGQSISLTQNKTGAIIKVRCTKELKLWLDKTNGDYLVISEETGKPYGGDNFRDWFARIKKDLGMEDKLFMDLRRTAMVRLGEAGCEIPEIAAVSGHDIETCQKILEVYLPRNSTMAHNAIVKLENYRELKLNEKLNAKK